MSSKGKSSATTVGETASVPKLRFPEFRNANGWDNKPLSEVLSSVVRARSKPSKLYTGLGLRSHGKGTFLKEEEDPAKNAMDVLFEVKRDDLIVNITFAWEGAIAIAGLSDDGTLVSHRFPTYTFKEGKALPEFFRYRIIEKRFVYNLGVISPGGAGRNRVMSKTDFLKLKVWLPDIAEQQKIADYLNSADALITAQGRKVEALRVHKKALMQQLFPEEGETQPRLRFPEFEGTSDWKPRAVGSVCTSFSGGTPSTSNPEFYGGEIPFIRSAEIGKERTELFLTRAGLDKSAAKLVKKGDVLVALYGANSGEVAVARIHGAINQAILCLRPSESGGFLSQFLICRKDWIITKYLQGGQGNLSGEIVKSVLLVFPSQEEQQRIADCLTSLDDLIAAETRKFDTLKTHKTGLMQQLFPPVGENDE